MLLLWAKVAGHGRAALGLRASWQLEKLFTCVCVAQKTTGRAIELGGVGELAQAATAGAARP